MNENKYKNNKTSWPFSPIYCYGIEKYLKELEKIKIEFENESEQNDKD